MKIHNEFQIAAPLEAAWAILDDVPRVARCAPGAELLGMEADGTSTGTIGVKLGPIALSFKGTVKFVDKDAEAHRVVAKARGSEQKARGSASADVTFTLARVGEGTKVVVDSDITLVGAIAQYGRGAALIQGTAQALMDQFARNLEADLAGEVIDPARKSISMPGVLARGLWNAGAGLLRKDKTPSEEGKG